MKNEQSLKDIRDWDSIASDYTQSADPTNNRIYNMVKDVLWDCLGDLQDMDVLDLGCGHGWLSKEFFDAGAKVYAIDGSSALIEIGRSLYPEIDFIQYDLFDGLPFEYEEFDRVVAFMVLADIPDIDLLVASVRKSLKASGKFIFAIPHPCFFNYPSNIDEESGRRFRMVYGYLDPEVWRISSYGGFNHYHRSLTYYFDILHRNKLAVSRIYEPPQIASPSHPDPLWISKIPIFMLIEAVPTI
jgi:SAM-dependent methyltransferase